MKKYFNKFISLSVLVIVLLSACNLGVTPPSDEEVVSDSPVELSTALPPTESVQHVMIPGELPTNKSGILGDHDSSTTSNENRAPSGDRFTFGRYERPFNSEAMDIYFPYLDIQLAEFAIDDTWMYATITVKGDELSSQSLVGKYGFEIDLSVNGGGDYLIMVLQPSSTEWTTNNVQVWFDENDDVGGEVKVVADDVPTQGNGYETQIFGSGQEDDPDLAWARISPTDPNSVQMAVKLSLLAGDTTFMVGMWAGTDDLDATLFDINDMFTHEQAGSSLKEFEFFYPVKEVSELDNTCRMAIGFQPTGNEPGGCPVPVPGDDSPPPPGQSCPPPSILYC
ncbi:MAG TPA: hypothetical protein DIW23_08985, partial [Anaerolineae bacterium]|nr:hypothetical protein [Anaerolineae bacterium]